MRISTVFKGFFVGATMLVPGVSGGSMAMILGEYERLISSVSSFRKDVKGNAFYLMQFVFPALLGMVLLSNPLLSLIEIYTLPMMYLFMGAVLGGVPLVLREAKIKKL
jgi:putative membrane protein